MKADRKNLIESLSNQAHISWSGWQKYVFDKSKENEDGSYTIPKSLVDRWMRQIDTDYKDLSEKEKESDRIEAREYLKIFDDFLSGDI